MDAELRQKMTLAKEHYLHHEYDRAEPILREIIAEHPGSAEMFNMLGVIQHHRGRFADALHLFEQALHLNPGYTEAALNLSVVGNDLGRYDEAAEIYGKAMAQAEKQPRQMDPFARGKLANMHAATSEAYRELRLYQEAVAEMRMAVRLCPSFPDLRCRLAQALSEMGDREGAIAEYRELLDATPRYVAALIQLGAELYALGRKEEARTTWEQAQSFAPDDRRLPVYLNLR